MEVKTFRISNADLNSIKRLNKFMPLERALNLLNDKYIWFANPEEWIDPYEKRFICAKYDNSRPFAWKGRVFCSCFTWNGTSEASWNAYSNSSDCVQISFNGNALRQLLNDYAKKNKDYLVFFDAVEYMQTKEIEKPLKDIGFKPPLTKGATYRTREFKERLLLLKRKAFEYEREYRAIIVKSKSTKEKGIKIEFDSIKKLIASITIGPKTGSDTYRMLKDVLCEKYGFDKGQIMQSFLYKAPSIPIIKTK